MIHTQNRTGENVKKIEGDKLTNDLNLSFTSCFRYLLVILFFISLIHTRKKNHILSFLIQDPFKIFETFWLYNLVYNPFETK